MNAIVPGNRAIRARTRTGIEIAVRGSLMSSMLRFAPVAGALFLFTAACGSATGAEDLFQDPAHDGATTSAGPAATETNRSSSETAPSSSAAPSSSSSAKPPGTSATCAAVNVPQAQGPMCSRQVTVASFEIARASCYVDTTIDDDGVEGTLLTPCDGDGEATLVFGSLTFRGAIVGGELDVCAGTEFLWKDGCDWTSAQRVSGSLADGVLVFGYGEAPKPGEAGCASACTASGSLRVE